MLLVRCVSSLIRSEAPVGFSAVARTSAVRKRLIKPGVWVQRLIVCSVKYEQVYEGCVQGGSKVY